MDKKGEGVPWYLLAFILMVIVLLVVWLGSSPKFRSLFGITETQIRNLNETGSSLFDFKRVFGIKTDNVEDSKVFDAETYMNNLLATNNKASLEEFLGICNGEEKYKSKFDAAVLEKLKSYCTEERKMHAEGRLREINQGDITNLWKEFVKLKDNGIYDKAKEVLEQIENLPLSEADKRLVSDAKTDLEGKIAQAKEKIVGLGLQNKECENKESVASAWKCEGDAFLAGGVLDESRYDSALRAYTNYISETRGVPDLNFEGYKLLGDTYVKKGEKAKGYNLYEDILVQFEDKVGEFEGKVGESFRYALVKKELHDLAKGDIQFYRSNILLSKVNYYSTFHASLIVPGGVLYALYDWISFPLDSKSGNRGGMLDSAKELTEITFNPKIDFLENQKNSFTALKNKPENAADVNCFKSDKPVFNYQWGSKKGQVAVGPEVNFIIKDIAGNVICDYTIYGEGKTFKQWQNERQISICGEFVDSQGRAGSPRVKLASYAECATEFGFFESQAQSVTFLLEFPMLEQATLINT